MRSSITRLLAVLAAAILSLSPMLMADAAQAKDSVAGHVQTVVALLDDDSGAARDDIGQYGRVDPGASRNDIGNYVPPETPTTPVVEDSGGVDAGTVALAVAVGVVAVGIGVSSFLLVRRAHNHHLAHPA